MSVSRQSRQFGDCCGDYTSSAAEQKPYPIYELAGPRVYSYEELLRTVARTAGLRPVVMRMPFALWNALAGVAEILPRPPP